MEWHVSILMCIILKSSLTFTKSQPIMNAAAPKWYHLMNNFSLTIKDSLCATGAHIIGDHEGSHAYLSKIAKTTHTICKSEDMVNFCTYKNR